jgi:hypothetical protein
MGANPYWYYTKYQANLNAVLQSLRQQEFEAGRYNPAIKLLDFPITEKSPSPGAQHLSMEDALMASDADGTRSILDILRVSDTPCPLSRDEFEAALLGQGNYEILGEIFNTAFPLSTSELIELFGTEQPTHDMVQSVIFGKARSEAAYTFWESIDRGTARYIHIYDEGEPSEIFFLGYSFD